MHLPSDYTQLDLILTEGKITSYLEVPSETMLKSFPRRITQSNIAKIYVLKENDEFLYVGTTMQSMASRIRYGLYATGKNGYHGYKWKHKEKVRLYVWLFEGLNKVQIEAIEAELVYLIRNETGSWPMSQNEIHFNNEFDKGKEYASMLFAVLNNAFYANKEKVASNDMKALFAFAPGQWGLRGDPYLWRTLKYAIALEQMPQTSEAFRDLLIQHFIKYTGHRPIPGQNYYVKQFAFGGMSSGMVNSDFWLNLGLPLLIRRFESMREQGT